jgi:hypothetical protein
MDGTFRLGAGANKVRAWELAAYATFKAVRPDLGCREGALATLAAACREVCTTLLVQCAARPAGRTGPALGVTADAIASAVERLGAGRVAPSGVAPPKELLAAVALELTTGSPVDLAAAVAAAIAPLVEAAAELADERHSAKSILDGCIMKQDLTAALASGAFPLLTKLS